MSKYQVYINDELDDAVFDTEEDAVEHAEYLASCTRYGAEILHMSNPGDYDADDYDDGFEIVEIDD